MQISQNAQSYLEVRLPEYFELLRQMVAINSFTANPQGVNQVGVYTRDLFASLGFEDEAVPSVNPAYGNHLFLRHTGHTQGPGESPFIALVSHLDTVFPPEEEIQNDFVWRVEGDRIYGPGTVDIKGGTLMIYMVLDALQQIVPEVFDSTTWMVCLNASEEVLADDFAEFSLQRLPQNTRACLVFEGGTLSGDEYPIVTARKGKATFRITAEGRSAHAGNAHTRGANAILQLAHTIQQVESYTDYANQITFNVGVVGGGVVVNRVPSQAEARVEVRAFSPEIFEEGVQKILVLDGSSDVSSHDGYPCQVKVELEDRTSPWPINKDTQALFTLWQQVGSELGLRITPETRGGLSDGNLLWEHFPTLDGLGPVGANAHCAEQSPDGSKEQEFALASSFVPKARMNVLALMKLLQSRNG